MLLLTFSFKLKLTYSNFKQARQCIDMLGRQVRKPLSFISFDCSKAPTKAVQAAECHHQLSINAQPLQKFIASMAWLNLLEACWTEPKALTLSPTIRCDVWAESEVPAVGTVGKISSDSKMFRVETLILQSHDWMVEKQSPANWCYIMSPASEVISAWWRRTIPTSQSSCQNSAKPMDVDSWRLPSYSWGNMR